MIKTKGKYLLLALPIILILLPTGSALAADGTEAAAANSVAIDTVWTLMAAFLVFIMQAGFAMVESGFTRAKNAGNIIMKNLMDFASGSLVFWLVGFAIMFGIDKSGLFGWSGFLTNEAGFAHLELSIPLLAFLLFQTVFCATAATIVSGAMAERTKFVSYLIYSVVISAVIYPVVGHWVWGGGWLAERGFIDFAGSTVVHSVGGWAGLAGATLLGARIGKYTEDGQSKTIRGHSLTLGALGVFLLWFGWFGFNPGSTLAGTDLSIALIATNTNLAAAAGAVAAMLVTWIRSGHPDVGMTLNGALGGLVAITAGAASVIPGSAILIGLIGGVITVFAIEFIDKVLHVDDPVGAISVHAGAGAMGTVLVGVFAIEGGLLYGGGTQLLLTQIVGVVAVAAWTLGTSFVLFKVIDLVTGLRVSREEEVLGLDLGEHEIEAYADFVPRSADVPAAATD